MCASAQGPLDKHSDLGPAHSWAEQPWFQRVWFAAENQGKGKQGVSSVEDISTGTAFAYKQQLLKPSTTATQHLAWYLQMLRNVLCHAGEDAEAAGADTAGAEAAVAAGAGLASADLSAVLNPVGLDRSLAILETCPFAPQAPTVFRELLAYASRPAAGGPAVAASLPPADAAGTSGSVSASLPPCTGSAAGAAMLSPLLSAPGWMSGPGVVGLASVPKLQLQVSGPGGHGRPGMDGLALPVQRRSYMSHVHSATPRRIFARAAHTAVKQGQARACRAHATGSLWRL